MSAAGLVAEVQAGEGLAGRREGVEVVGEGDARKLLGQIVGEALAEVRRVENAVDVSKMAFLAIFGSR